MVPADTDAPTPFLHLMRRSEVAGKPQDITAYGSFVICNPGDVSVMCRFEAIKSKPNGGNVESRIPSHLYSFVLPPSQGFFSPGWAGCDRIGRGPRS
ncbi:hypothetical protein ZHAS_00021584 [Anopheles sinensis]|uniref:Uncharacterized protein n=1 Tax=Anopheles sinensis TaxID=74873 RepID=A0A084WST5_ANOSI|nr:hypothetical protein ZHAS_00021584 [Anopheles sinensis]